MLVNFALITTKEKNFHTCKTDIAFKEIFGNNKKLLRWLIESSLNELVSVYDYLNNEQTNNDLISKRKRLDLLVSTSVGQIKQNIQKLLTSYHFRGIRLLIGTQETFEALSRQKNPLH